MTREERREAGILMLPRNLKEALEAMEEDALVKSVLGETVSRSYIREKYREWEEYTVQVSKWETDRYLYRI